MTVFSIDYNIAEVRQFPRDSVMEFSEYLQWDRLAPFYCATLYMNYEEERRIMCHVTCSQFAWMTSFSQLHLMQSTVESFSLCVCVCVCCMRKRLSKFCRGSQNQVGRVHRASPRWSSNCGGFESATGSVRTPHISALEPGRRRWIVQ